MVVKELERYQLYYFISLKDMEIQCCPYLNDVIDKTNIKYGNIFLTSNEAETALEKIKKVLKGEL